MPRHRTPPFRRATRQKPGPGWPSPAYTLRRRRLPKRALELTAADLRGRRVEDWAVGDSPWKRAIEDDLARVLDGIAAAQAAGNDGNPFRAVSIKAGTCPCEAVKSLQGERFLIGVEWHPDLMAEQPEQLRLFAALVDAAHASDGG